MADPGAEPTPEFEERRRLSFWERMDAIEQECRRGHQTLRKDISELQAQTTALSKALEALTAAMTTMANAPMESSRLRFTPSALFTLFSAVVIVVGSAWVVRSDVRDLTTQTTATAKLQDERTGNLKSAIERMEQQRLTDKAEAARLLQKYDNEALARNLQQQGAKK